MSSFGFFWPQQCVSHARASGLKPITRPASAANEANVGTLAIADHWHRRLGFYRPEMSDSRLGQPGRGPDSVRRSPRPQLPRGRTRGRYSGPPCGLWSCHVSMQVAPVPVLTRTSGDPGSLLILQPPLLPLPLRPPHSVVYGDPRLCAAALL